MLTLRNIWFGAYLGNLLECGNTYVHGGWFCGAEKGGFVFTWKCKPLLKLCTSIVSQGFLGEQFHLYGRNAG